MSARGPRRSRAAAGLSVLAALLATGSAAAQTSTAEPSRFNFTGYVQPQYEIRRRDGKTSDRVLFRRLVLGLDTTVAGPWTTQLQIDFGPIATSHDERLVVKDAYLRYEGPAASGITVTIGNQKVPFSRTLLASSSRRGLVERPVTGDRSLGSPGRAPGVFAAGWHRRRSIHWTAGAAYSQQSPDAQEVRVDGPAEAQSDWNKGLLLAGRVELHPRGEVPRPQGDFAHGPLTVVASLAAYRWSRRDETLRQSSAVVNAETVRALEVSGGVRGRGLSADVEFEHVVADAVDRASRGLYIDGRAAIDKGSIEAGYMLLPRRLEALLGFDTASSAAFDATWQRASAGMNWYVNGHRLKFSVMHRESFNDRGARDERSHTTYLQTQFSF